MLKLQGIADTLLPALMLVGVCVQVSEAAHISHIIITSCAFCGYMLEKIKNGGK